jgi:predicted metalloprotease
MSTVMTTVRLMRAPGMRMSLPAEAGGTGGVEVALVLVLELVELEVDEVVKRVDVPLESEDNADVACEEIEEATEDAVDSIEDTSELAFERAEDAWLDAAPEMEEATLLKPVAVTGATMVVEDPETTVV